MELVSSDDMEINAYLQHCHNIVYKLRNVIEKYANMSEMLEDAEEFNKIYQLSSEISSIASGWLGLNQGLPTDDLGIIKRFSSMSSVITGRERALGINDSKMYTDSENPKDKIRADRYLSRVVSAIHDNNPELPIEYIFSELEYAHNKGLIGTFDVYKYLTEEDYRKDMIRYTHLIKGTLNVLDMMEEIPHYKQIIRCFTSLAVSKEALSSKNRLITRFMHENNLNKLTDQQLKGMLRFVDRLNGLNYFKSFDSPITLHNTSIEGFDRYFAKTSVSVIDLTTFEGMATFKHWIEHEVLEDLRKNYSDNPLVKHLRRVADNRRDILATDIDLLNPNTTTTSVIGYNEILQGMALFESDPKSQNYLGTGYSIADLFQMYNIMVNANQVGSERLTAAFKYCVKPTNQINKYLNFVAKQDYSQVLLQDYETMDYQINAAPIVSTASERFRKEPFIKVNDPVVGYILKRYDPIVNSYKEFSLIPPKQGHESTEDTLKRLQNFTEYCPYEMPVMIKTFEMMSAIDFDEDEDISEELVERIKNVLLDLSSAGKIIALIDC
jgi:hypothetical protein